MKLFAQQSRGAARSRDPARVTGAGAVVVAGPAVVVIVAGAAARVRVIAARYTSIWSQQIK